MKRKSKIKNNKTINKKVIANSLSALVFLALSYFVNWIFMIPVAIIIWINQKELMKK